ncbi:hypothetical protein MYX75_00740 [Acidobacteria bacterium AH-259-A15]|nr:hypothetical protein [Acidobacteria bacterium AH-259-A15]
MDESPACPPGSPLRSTSRAQNHSRGPRLRQELQRHGLAELEVVGAVDLAHPAAAEEPDHPVAPGQHGARGVKRASRDGWEGVETRAA